MTAKISNRPQTHFCRLECDKFNFWLGRSVSWKSRENHKIFTQKSYQRFEEQKLPKRPDYSRTDKPKRLDYSRTNKLNILKIISAISRVSKPLSDRLSSFRREKSSQQLIDLSIWWYNKKLTIFKKESLILGATAEVATNKKAA